LIVSQTEALNMNELLLRHCQQLILIPFHSQDPKFAWKYLELVSRKITCSALASKLSSLNREQVIKYTYKLYKELELSTRPVILSRTASWQNAQRTASVNPNLQTSRSGLRTALPPSVSNPSGEQAHPHKSSFSALPAGLGKKQVQKSTRNLLDAPAPGKKNRLSKAPEKSLSSLFNIRGFANMIDLTVPQKSLAHSSINPGRPNTPAPPSDTVQNRSDSAQRWNPVNPTNPLTMSLQPTTQSPSNLLALFDTKNVIADDNISLSSEMWIILAKHIGLSPEEIFKISEQSKIPLTYRQKVNLIVEANQLTPEELKYFEEQGLLAKLLEPLSAQTEADPINMDELLLEEDLMKN